MSEQISYNQLSGLTGKAFRTIRRRFEQAGIKPVAEEGNKLLFDSAIALDCIYNSSTVGSDGLDLQEERAKLAIEQTRQKKRENDIEEGLVAPIEVLTEVLSTGCSQIASVLDALPMSIKKKCPALTARDMDFIKKEIARCRNTAAKSAVSVTRRSNEN